MVSIFHASGSENNLCLIKPACMHVSTHGIVVNFVRLFSQLAKTAKICKFDTICSRCVVCIPESKGGKDSKDNHIKRPDAFQ